MCENATEDMERQRFERLVEKALDELPEQFAQRLKNLVVVVEECPPKDRRGKRDDQLMGEYIGVPLTARSAWEAHPPDRIVLYQKNIEAACRTEEQIREEVRLTVVHELGHYFGLGEEQLEDV
jgi:predicted Zn-dependent protease with MMP-like domain